MLNAPGRGNPPAVSGRDFWGLLELLKSTEDQRQAMLDIKTAEEALAAQAAQMRAEQTTLVEAERQLNERKENLDLSWANLRNEQKAFDDQQESVKESFARREGELDERTVELNGRYDALDGRLAALDARSKELGEGWRALETAEQKSLAGIEEANQALAVREAAVSEREKAADDLSAMLAKVKG